MHRSFHASGIDTMMTWKMPDTLQGAICSELIRIMIWSLPVGQTKAEPSAQCKIMTLLMQAPCAPIRFTSTVEGGPRKHSVRSSLLTCLLTSLIKHVEGGHLASDDSFATAGTGMT